MNTNKWKQFIAIPFAALLVACGNLPLNLRQPEAGSPSAPEAPQAAGTPAETGAGQGESEPVSSVQTGLTYPIVDTSEGKCYDERAEVACPAEGGAFYGQDAQYAGNAPRYRDNGDATVSDLITGLTWQQDPGEKMTYAQAAAGADGFSLAGYDDWRLPTIKELYSLILFDGTDVSVCSSGTCQATPFIDTRYFDFSYGDESAGERIIDSQFASSTKYVSATMGGNETMFGVNFADGRIKGYPTDKLFYVLYVRGNPNYGQNSFVDNGNGAVTDNATGLTWMQDDSGMGMDWESALNYCESLDHAGAADWRLPNVKELQSIVDYSRSPDATNSAAIDPIFNVSAITNEAGQTDHPFYWSSTTHADSAGHGGYGSYVSFGRALGYMNSQWVDVHGAGAQRSDPKSGSASDYPTGHGPQGDAIRVDNYVRCVRGGSASLDVDGNPSPARPTMTVTSTTGASMPGQGGQAPQGQGQGTQQGAGGGQPPQEAVNACAGSSRGAACSFTTPNGPVEGGCQLIQAQLACVPENRP
ncbi:MAG: DUF1566 domain-containing protein [Chloroflexota bacterium]